MSDYMGTFTIAEVGKQSAKMTFCKAQGGQPLFIYNDKMAGIVAGAVIACTYTIGDPKRQGDMPPYFVKAINSVQGAVPPAQAPQPAAAYAPPLPQQPAPAAPVAAPVGDPKEEGMFVMGVVGRAMGSGNFSVEDIPALAKWAVIGWRGRYDPV